MSYLYLIFSVLTLSLSSVLCEFYNRRTINTKNATQLFNFVRMVCTLIVWCVIFIIDFSFEWGVLIYSLGFGACFAVTNIALIHAFKCGSVALTSLMLQMSLIGVTAWGLVFWDAPFTIFVGVGLALVIISITLCILDKKTESNIQKKVNLKWLAFASLAFLGNAGCSIIQREQQIAYAGKHGSLLMVFGMIIATLVCLVLYLKSDRRSSVSVLKRNLIFPAGAGVSNALLNLFVILLATSELSPSLIYPVLAVGGLAVTMMFSLFAFKEVLRWWQWVGVILGAVAIALLNL